MKPAHCPLVGNSECAEKLTVPGNVYPFKPALAVQASVMTDLPAAQGAPTVEENDGQGSFLYGRGIHDGLNDDSMLH